MKKNRESRLFSRFEAPRCRSYGRRFPEPSYMFTLVDRGADLLLAAGYKESGIGREFSLEGMLESYTQRKNVTVNLTH